MGNDTSSGKEYNEEFLKFQNHIEFLIKPNIKLDKKSEESYLIPHNKCLSKILPITLEISNQVLKSSITNSFHNTQINSLIYQSLVEDNFVDENYHNEQFGIINEINNGNLFDTRSVFSSRNSHNLFNHSFTNYDLEDKNENMDGTTQRKKKLENLEISDINNNNNYSTNQNLTNLMDEDLENFLKNGTQKKKNSIENQFNLPPRPISQIGNHENSISQNQKSNGEKDLSNLNHQNSRIKDTSIENKSSTKTKIVHHKTNEEMKFRQNKNTVNVFSGSSRSNINNNSHKYSARSKSPLDNKFEKKPKVNIKMDLKDIVREEIFENYVHNTSSIQKKSITPERKVQKSPFESKNKTPIIKNDFTNFVEYCSNPNKKGNVIINPDKFKKNSITRVTNNTNKKIQIEEKKSIVRVSKVKGQKDNEMKDSNNGMILKNKVNDKIKKIKKNRIVTLDISDDGDVVDRTNRVDDSYEFRPSEKVKQLSKKLNEDK